MSGHVARRCPWDEGFISRRLRMLSSPISSPFLSQSAGTARCIWSCIAMIRAWQEVWQKEWPTRNSWSGGVEQLHPGAVVAVASDSRREPHERPLGIEPLLARPGYFLRWCQLQFGDRS